MARAGRKRKSGPRHPSGQLVRKIADAERRLRESEMGVVLAQPHRRGNRGQLAESAIGRFIEAHGLRRELYDAALQWAETRQKWTNAVGAPRLTVAEKNFGTGADVTSETIGRWRSKDLEARGAMQRAGGVDGLRGVMRLAGDDAELHAHTPIEAIVNALMSLAVHLGLLPPSALPELKPAPRPRPPLKAATPEPEVADAPPWRPKMLTPATPAAPKERKPINQAERLKKLQATVSARRERRAAEAGPMAIAAE